MPVPQIINFVFFDFKQGLSNRQDAHTTVNNFLSCGVGILPAPKSYLLTLNYDKWHLYSSQ